MEKKYYGEPLGHDPSFNGPVQKNRRSCTDIIMLMLLILFLGAWMGLGIYSSQKGSIESLLAPVDSNGRRCGVDAQVMDKKHLVYFNILKCFAPHKTIFDCPTTQVCVEKCPDETILFAPPQLDSTTFPQLKSSMVCTYDINVENLTYTDALQNIQNGKCASFVASSKAVFGRCIVNIAETIKDKRFANFTDGISSNSTKKFQEASAEIIEEIMQSRWYMVQALLAVVVVCFAYILLLRWVIAPLVWTAITLLLIAISIVLYFCYDKYQYYKENPPPSIVDAYNDYHFWLAAVIVVAIVLCILFLLVVFLRKRINLAIAMIKEGSKAVFAVKSTILFPIFPWLTQCAVIAYALTVLLLLLSAGKESSFKIVNLNHDEKCVCSKNYTHGESCNPAGFDGSCMPTLPSGDCSNVTCNFNGISGNNLRILHFYNMLVFFWTTFFISGVADMMLASTFATWYWTFKKRSLPFFTLTAGICTTLRYHLGTVAFGSLITAIIRVMRVIAAMIDHKTKGIRNPVATLVFCFLKCCLRILEKLFKFISKNAYIMCAIHGKSFCPSARDSFSLLMRNILRVYVLDKVVDFIFFLSKVLISIGAGFGMYYYLMWRKDDLQYAYVPAIIVGLATYIIATIFFNVYAIAVDTLFLCFLEDCERNDGTPEKPYFMSKNLMRILGRKNQKPKDE